MSTILFEEYVFGPVKSRRLGVSLGINLLPLHSKLCNFNCIYCECGWNRSGTENKQFNKREDILTALENKLKEMQSSNSLPDAITFSGNGEPTMHPEFAQIMDEVIEKRNQFSPKAQICVLSNATLIHKESVMNALLKADKAILKLDSALDNTAKLIDQPQGEYSVKQTIERMKVFQGKMILQTMFLKGNFNGKQIDNTTETEINAWVEAVQEINPSEITIYSIDRETPANNLFKVSKADLESIAERVRSIGFKVQVS